MLVEVSYPKIEFHSTPFFISEKIKNKTDFLQKLNYEFFF